MHRSRPAPVPVRLRRRTAPWAAALLVIAGCGTETPDAPAVARSTGPVDFAAVESAFGACLDDDPDAGVARLDSVLEATPGAPDALVARGLCRWARWDETDDAADARGAYDDLSEAIGAVEGGTAARGTPLDQIYSHRAFVAQALDGGWTRTLEDLDAAVRLDPDEPRHVLDRGVVHSYAGDTLDARRDLRRYLALADSAGADDPQRRRVVEALLDELGVESP